MVRKGKGEMSQIVFNFKDVKAKEMSQFYRAVNSAPEEAMDQIAGLLAKTVQEAPIEGDLKNPETWLDLPVWGEEGSEALTWNKAIQALQDAMEALTKK